jgi:type IV pilus assembly protein PilV
MKRTIDASWRHARGVSLIEVLVAVLVLSVGLLGLAALQGFSLQANQGAYHRTQAVNVAYELADFYRVNRGNPGLVDTTFWENRVAEHLPTGTLNVAQNGNVVTISVVWQDNRLGDQPGGGESVVIGVRL